MTTKANPIQALRQLTASEVKNQWKQVKRSVQDLGPVVVTNHNDPEVVILSVQDYARIMARLAEADDDQKAKLEALRRRFDERLASLQAPDAGDRLRSIMASPARVDGQLKAGTDF